MRLLALITYLLALLPTASMGQTCSGSLGDPVVNQDFGTKGFSLPAGHTSYQFTGGCPNNPGTYTLSDFLFGCGPRTWVQMIGDHTPDDSQGNYMLVNASNTPGTIYKDTARNLCSNTVYQLGMWITPVMTSFACNGTPVLPNVRYEIRTLAGTVLRRDSTGPLPIVQDRDWKFYGFSVVTPANITDLVIEVSISPANGCGAAFGIDDITLRPCSPSVVSATINGSTDPVDVCANYTNDLTIQGAFTPGFVSPVFQWQQSLDTGKTWTDIPGANTLNYLVPHRTDGVILYRICVAENGQMSSLSCRVSSNEMHTGVHPVPAANPPQTLIACVGQDFHFPLADPKALQVLWTGPNSFQSTLFGAVIPNFQYPDTGVYQLEKTFHFNCVMLDTFHVIAYPGTVLTVQPVQPLCEGSSQQLLVSANAPVTWSWSPATGLSNPHIGNPLASPTVYTEYWVTATNQFGCKDSAELIIDVFKKPVADAGPDRAINLGDSIRLASAVDGTQVGFFWSPATYMNDNRAIQPVVFPPQDIVYTLTVTSNVGCGVATSTVRIRVYTDVFVPDAFTPNNDGRNDKFYVLAADNYKSFRLQVFNRWGQAVFSSTDIHRQWDGMLGGQVQPAGVYIYYVDIVTAGNKHVSRKGSVILIR